jgi:single-stranded-DNA-specific exonuclease
MRNAAMISIVAFARRIFLRGFMIIYYCAEIEYYMKTVILTHSDADGMCAGAIALAMFPKSRVFFTKPVSLYDDLKDCKDERIIITDIAINHGDEEKILETFRGKKSEIWYIDHHPMSAAMKSRMRKTISVFVHGDKISTSELMYKQIRTEIPKERAWLAIYGAIGDYSDNTEFVQGMLLNWDMRAIYLEASVLVMGIKEDEFEKYDNKRAIVEKLASGINPTDIQGLMSSARDAVKKEFELYEFVKKNAEKRGCVGLIRSSYLFGFRGPSALFASTVTNTKVGVSVFSRKNHTDLTLRARDRRIELNSIASKAAEAVGGSGGGLENAAGARIPLEKLDEFIENLNRILKAKKL